MPMRIFQDIGRGLAHSVCQLGRSGISIIALSAPFPHPIRAALLQPDRGRGTAPRSRRLLRSLIQAKQDYESGEADLDAIKQRITLLGGILAPRDEIVASRTRMDSAERALKSTVEQIAHI